MSGRNEKNVRDTNKFKRTLRKQRTLEKLAKKRKQKRDQALNWS